MCIFLSNAVESLSREDTMSLDATRGQDDEEDARMGLEPDVDRHKLPGLGSL